ncbi:Hypothetical predicted protein [Lynx pardinus]|uniref:Uncharacterized protein n=1 Tax=Lynx pardinus TaxID=191816 RepID=A0A485P0D2_LYNPA|nr:Hypothetical predicted protein [Lynx pardinus]
MAQCGILDYPSAFGHWWQQDLMVFSQWCRSQILLQYLKGQVVILYHYYFKFEYSAMEPSIPGWNMTYEIFNIKVSLCLAAS